MNVDLLIAGLLAMFGLLGLVSGAIKQLSHWAGLGLAYVLAWPLAGRLTPLLAPRLGYPPIGVKIGLSVLGFFALYVLGTIAAHFALAKIAGNREKGRLDHAGGFVLGLAKGGVIVFVALSTALFFEKPLTEALGRLPDAAQKSAVVGFVRRHNLFDVVSLPAMAKIQKLAEAARNPQSAQSLESMEPQLQEMLKDPALQSMLKDQHLDEMLKSGDMSAIKNDPRLSALLKDPRISDQLSLKGADTPQ
jgi:membrane protein required for colicin V production